MEILKSKKLLLGLLLILVIEISWAVWYLKNTQHETRDMRHEISENKELVSFLLDPDSGEFPIGEEFLVALALNAGKKQTIGADAILKYDPQELEVLEIIPGEIFDFYPLLKIEEEKILISGVSQSEKTFSGQGILVQLKLKGKTQGETKLRFEFEPGQTTDSNVALKNSLKDGLEEVQSGSYTFR